MYSGTDICTYVLLYSCTQVQICSYVLMYSGTDMYLCTHVLRYRYVLMYSCTQVHIYTYLLMYSVIDMYLFTHVLSYIYVLHYIVHRYKDVIMYYNVLRYKNYLKICDVWLCTHVLVNTVNIVVRQIFFTKFRRRNIYLFYIFFFSSPPWLEISLLNYVRILSLSLP